jgi:tetratricopeptide (TPR) repeat protein
VDVETLRLSVTTWLREYRNLIFGVAGIVLFAIGGMLYARYLKRVALAEFRSGVAAFQEGDFEKAIAPLEKMRRSSSAGVEARALGLFYLGEAYAKRERKDDARKAYEDALALVKNNREKAKYIAQLILLKLGQDAEQRGEHAQARQWYDQAAGIEGGPLQVEALAQAARSLERANDRAGAMTYYEKLIAKEDERYPLGEVFREKIGE